MIKKNNIWCRVNVHNHNVWALPIAGRVVLVALVFVGLKTDPVDMFVKTH